MHHSYSRRPFFPPAVTLFQFNAIKFLAERNRAYRFFDGVAILFFFSFFVFFRDANSVHVIVTAGGPALWKPRLNLTFANPFNSLPRVRGDSTRGAAGRRGEMVKKAEEGKQGVGLFLAGRRLSFHFFPSHIVLKIHLYGRQYVYIEGKEPSRTLRKKLE